MRHCMAGTQAASESSPTKWDVQILQNNSSKQAIKHIPQTWNHQNGIFKGGMFHMWTYFRNSPPVKAIHGGILWDAEMGGKSKDSTLMRTVREPPWGGGRELMHAHIHLEDAFLTIIHSHGEHPDITTVIAGSRLLAALWTQKLFPCGSGTWNPIKHMVEDWPGLRRELIQLSQWNLLCPICNKSRCLPRITMGTFPFNGSTVKQKPEARTLSESWPSLSQFTPIIRKKRYR